MNKLAIVTFAVASAAAALTMSVVPSYARGTCKDVYVQAVNNTGKRIKVIDMDYVIDGYGTKSEPVRNEEIPAGKPWAKTRNLEQASGRITTIIVKYRVSKSGFTKWTSVKKAYSTGSVCNSGGSYSLTLN